MTQGPVQLDEYLDTLKAEGSLDSHGFFSITQEKALHKLKEYQLQDPYSYPVHFLSGALLRGADYFEVNTSRLKCEYRFNGAPLTPDEIKNLYTVLLGSSSNTPGENSLIKIAVAVHALRSLETRRILIHMKSGYKATIKDVHLKIDKSTLPPENNIIVVEKKLSLSNLFTPPETDYLLNLCRYAPLKLTINGHRINLPFTVPPEINFAVWLELHPTDQKWFLHSAAPRHCLRLKKTWNLPACAVLVLSSSPWSQNTGVKIIVDGIAHSYKADDFLEHAGVCALISDPRLKQNVSYTRIIENDDFAMLRERLIDETSRLLQHIYRTHHLNNQQKLQLLEAMESELQRLPEQNSQDRLSLQYFIITARLRQNPPTTNEERALLELHQNLLKAQEPEKAQNLLQEFLLSWETEAYNFWLKGSYKSAGFLTTRIKEQLQRTFKGKLTPHGALAHLHQELEICLKAIDGNPEPAKIDNLIEEAEGNHQQYLLTTKALLLRLNKQIEQATELHSRLAKASKVPNLIVNNLLFLAECLIAKEEVRQAEELLKKGIEAAEALPDYNTKSLIEELVFLKMLQGRSTDRNTIIEYLKTTIEDAPADPHLNHLRQEALVKLLRGQLPLIEWIKAKVEVNLAELKDLGLSIQRKEIEQAVDKPIGFHDFTEELNISAKLDAVKSAEKHFSPISAYTCYTRRRITYQLRRSLDYKHKQQADLLCAQGHIHSRIHQLFNILLDNIDPEPATPNAT